MKRIPWLLLCLSCISRAAWADDAVDLARIASQRQLLSERFAAEERACHSRFVVTACLDDVRARQREALAPLRERELGLDDENRQRRALERRRAIAAKQQAAQARPPPPVLEPRLRQPKPGATPLPTRPATRQDDAGARAAQAQTRAQTQAQERVHAAEGRREQAKIAQARVARRLAEQQAQGKRPQPLPLPAAASGPPR